MPKDAASDRLLSIVRAKQATVNSYRVRGMSGKPLRQAEIELARAHANYIHGGVVHNVPQIDSSRSASLQPVALSSPAPAGSSPPPLESVDWTLHSEPIASAPSSVPPPAHPDGNGEYFHQDPKQIASVSVKANNGSIDALMDNLTMPFDAHSIVVKNQVRAAIGKIDGSDCLPLFNAMKEGVEPESAAGIPGSNQLYFPWKNGLEVLLSLFWLLQFPSRTQWSLLINLLEQIFDLLLAGESTIHEMKATLRHWDAFAKRMECIAFQMPDLPKESVRLKMPKDREKYSKFSAKEYNRDGLNLKDKEKKAKEDVEYSVPYIPMSWELLFFFGTPGCIGQLDFRKANPRPFLNRHNLPSELPTEVNQTQYAAFKDDFDQNTVISLRGHTWLLGVIYRSSHDEHRDKGWMLYRRDDRNNTDLAHLMASSGLSKTNISNLALNFDSYVSLYELHQVDGDDAVWNLDRQRSIPIRIRRGLTAQTMDVRDKQDMDFMLAALSEPVLEARVIANEHLLHDGHPGVITFKERLAKLDSIDVYNNALVELDLDVPLTEMSASWTYGFGWAAMHIQAPCFPKARRTL
jgi:hypothetical protein